MHQTDDKIKCFKTSGIWSSERAYTKIEFAGDNINMEGQRLKPYKIIIEINLGQSVLRVLVNYKWLIILQVLAIFTSGVASSTRTNVSPPGLASTSRLASPVTA